MASSVQLHMLSNCLANGQLQAVQHDTQDVKAELQQVKQDLAEASDAQEINFLRKRVESMDKHFVSLREEDNMLLRDQLGGSTSEANHRALVPSPSTGQKQQRGRHPVGTPPRSTTSTGAEVQERHVGKDMMSVHWLLALCTNRVTTLPEYSSYSCQ